MSGPPPPGARPVRGEDAFDVAVLHAWLRPQLALPAVPPDVLQFGGGASNLTYLLRYPGRDLVLRRPPVGRKAAGAHDMRREYDVQRLLRPSFGLVPEVLAYGDDEAVLGSPFYVMEHVPGVILRSELPEGVALDPQQAHALGHGVFARLADLHAVDIVATGLDVFSRGPGYVGRQVEGWSRRFRDARTDDVPDGEGVMAWLQAHQPADSGSVLIHGDWRFDNLVLDPADLSRVRAALDWEMATVGDPLMDLGAALAYWVQADDDAVFAMFRRQPSHLAGMPTRDEIVDAYDDRSGLDVGGWRFYEVYGLFRLAVIVQQIWWRYRHGQTTNPAFASFGSAAAYLLGRAGGRTG